MRTANNLFHMFVVHVRNLQQVKMKHLTCCFCSGHTVGNYSYNGSNGTVLPILKMTFFLFTNSIFSLSNGSDSRLLDHTGDTIHAFTHFVMSMGRGFAYCYQGSNILLW